MIVDLSCPVELRGYELMEDDKGNTRAYVRLFNLSGRTLVGYTATTNWYNGLTRARMTENIMVDQTRVLPRCAFKLMHSARNKVEADHIELYFSSVTFENGEVWTPRDGDLVDIGEQPMLEGAELDLLKAAAGEDAVQYPQVQKKYWRCVCGRINLLDASACIRCGRGQNQVLVTLNAKAIGKNRAPKRERPRAKNAAPAPKKRKAKRDTAFLKGILIALLILFIAIVGYELGKDDIVPKSAPAIVPAYETNLPANV